MRPSELTKALRRDDLTINYLDVEAWDVVENPWVPGCPGIETVEIVRVGDSAPMQALLEQECECGECGRVCLEEKCPCGECRLSCVPLAFGPVQEASHAAE